MGSERKESGASNEAAKNSDAEVDSRSDYSDSTELSTLVEVAPGLVAVYGDVPAGLDLFKLSLDLIPSFDRDKLSSALGSIGTWSTLGGNLAVAADSLQGLYRVDNATRALLQSGAELAAKDGANLGAIFKNGDLIAQARFIPAAMAPATVAAAIGPALALAAVQLKIDEVSGLVNSNIRLTNQILREIRTEQWSELDGLAKNLDKSVNEIRNIGTVSETIWDSVASQRTSVEKQLSQYKSNTAEHILKIRESEGRVRREYLETNAESIVFDSYALLTTLRIYAEYEAIRAGITRVRGQDDEAEGKLSESISENISVEIEKSLTEIRSLIDSLVRELQIIAELPEPKALPFTNKRKEAKTVRMSSGQILDEITPLYEKLQLTYDVPSTPDIVCAPEGSDLDQYLQILRWVLQRDEHVEAVAFAFSGNNSNLKGVVRGINSKRVDAVWEAIGSGRASGVFEKLTDGIFIAVTNQRLMIAPPKEFLRKADGIKSYALSDVRYVRGRLDRETSNRPAVDITLAKDNYLHWKFPEAAKHEDIDKLAELISRSYDNQLTGNAASYELEDKNS